ncbi:MAG: hypothetical protein ACR2OA_04570 [Rubripirellula sp.]|jgi:hypothetical protein
MMTHVASTLIDHRCEWNHQLLQNWLSRVLQNWLSQKLARLLKPAENDQEVAVSATNGEDIEAQQMT